ncbi:uncharacterized protein METZ01_LOCUS283439 [marine metagenome]|uniref:Uncharacterized protein n=1 Tax=marine metagenome TaxID=408172 RepID=A0A382L451_9ZZZZ
MMKLILKKKHLRLRESFFLIFHLLRLKKQKDYRQRIRRHELIQT